MKRGKIVSDYLPSALICILAAMCIILLFSPAAAQEKEEENFEQYVFPESESLFQPRENVHQSRFIPGVTTFGSAGIVYYALPSVRPFVPQFGMGLLIFSGIPDRSFGQTVADQSALALPLYTGFRYNFYRTETNDMLMAFYASVLGGPVIGMTAPHTGSIFPSFTDAQFRWGGGVEGSLGTEIFFSREWAGYIQVGVHTIGFNKPVGDASWYLGPTIGIGFGRVIRQR